MPRLVGRFGAGIKHASVGAIGRVRGERARNDDGVRSDASHRPQRVIRVAYFGLPLGALLLAADGAVLSSIVLSPTDAPATSRRSIRHVVR